MNNYTVELTNNIELIVSANSIEAAKVQANKEAAEMKQELLGAEPVLLDCSISF